MSYFKVVSYFNLINRGGAAQIKMRQGGTSDTSPVSLSCPGVAKKNTSWGTCCVRCFQGGRRCHMKRRNVWIYTSLCKSAAYISGVGWGGAWGESVFGRRQQEHVSWWIHLWTAELVKDASPGQLLAAMEVREAVIWPSGLMICEATLGPMGCSKLKSCVSAW